MIIKKIIKDIYNFITDHDRDFSDRLYICLFLSCEIPLVIALIGDVLTGENPVEIITIVILLVGNPILAIWGLYTNRIKMSSMITITLFLIIGLPILFFFGGGVEGGGVLWIIFAFVFVGLVMSGKARVVSLFGLAVYTISFFAIEYYHPEYVYEHSRKDFYIDAALSILIIGSVLFMITMIQKHLFMSENERAKKAVEKAEELTKSQNRFFSSMSHEIRTPINSILGLNELILREVNLSDEVVKDATGIQGAGKMLLSLINDILDFSKMEAGSMDIVPVDYRVGDMLSEIVNMIWNKAEEKGIKLGISIDPSVPSVLFGDEIRIRQIIINLLNNAVKYTGAGSIDLHMECADTEDEDKVRLIISISDTGMGIKKEVIPYLFDAFKRVDQEKNRMIEGTGLGLNIVKQIVDLMGGTISVSSVYGEGSIFTVELLQRVSDKTPVGELNIRNQKIARKDAYESRFTAPDASILIVDDNEMNLEVECKLLANTRMIIDRALSGKEALRMSLKRHYDVILMDHLMPEMDGITCLEELRNQEGGLNRTTHVIVLTANAGSENREQYNIAGFDDYLVKPVSGDALEEMLMKYISSEKLILSGKVVSMHENINAAESYQVKTPVVITSASTCDIPDSIIEKQHLNILPFMIQTYRGIFKDKVQMDSDELMRLLKAGKEAISMPPDEAFYTEFFANVLRSAHYIIHISITSSMSDDYKVASEAAKSFDNVKVINSESISSGTGILVLIAHKLSQQNIPIEEMVREIEEVKQRIKCSFIIETTSYMLKKRLVSERISKFAEAFNLHPCLKLSGDKVGVGGIWIGSIKRAYKKYINQVIPVDVIPDSTVVFITYVDVPMDTLLWIKEEISKKAYFRRVIFQQASAAISSNCGPGTVGIIYFVKSNKNYNIGPYFDDEIRNGFYAFGETENYEEALLEEPVDQEEEEAENEYEDLESEAETIEKTGGQAQADEREQKWYENIDAIDAEAAITNSGSEDALFTVLKIFYESIDVRAGEIEDFYNSEDWKNYTIKVHALKSSAKLIGALELSGKAEDLEMAGKEDNIDFIKENHASMISDFRKFDEYLAHVFEKEEESVEEIPDKPLVDDFILQSVYDGIKESAEAEDADSIGEILSEISDYSVTNEDEEKLETIRAKAGEGDFKGILEVLGNS